MPTKQWFEDNPKVSAYLPKELHAALQDWMAEKRVKKVSQAIIQILEIYLKSDSDAKRPEIQPENHVTTEQLKELREEIFRRLEKLETDMQQDREEKEDIPRKSRPEYSSKLTVKKSSKQQLSIEKQL